jgi:thiopeptide-type bacteriocin biosynthesis protein
MDPTAPATFAHSGFFVLRAPMLPFDALAGEAADRTQGARAAGAGGPVRLRERIRGLLARPEVREAVFVASPDLDARLEVWQRAADSEDGRRIEQTLIRYLARMAGRATPFGLFAGCSVGAIGSDSRLELGAACRRHTRLDMDYVAALAEALARVPDLRPSLRFRPNSSLHRVAGRMRYREVRREEKGWAHKRCAVELPDYLEVVLRRASGGATPAELILALREHDSRASEAEASEYVIELIDQQLLVSELAPPITGVEPIHDLIRKLRPHAAGRAVATRLEAVRDRLLSFDARGPGVAPQGYREIARELSALPAKVELARLFQVDLARPSPAATLGAEVVAEIGRGVELLRRIAARPARDPLANFRRAFRERYGDTPVTREVPLAEAVDDETGVGDGGPGESVAAAPVLDGLELRTGPEERPPFGAREARLLARVTGQLERGEREWVLSDDDLEELAVDDPPPLPDAFAALVRLEAESDEALDRGDFRLLLAGASGPSGARLLGRFCHADPELAAAVARHLRAEEALRPDALFAELVHLPEGRVGNILARPLLREREIAWLGRSGLPEKQQIPVGELRVSLCGERVVLTWHGREVAPRLTSAHDFGANQGIYRFLCSLQDQGVAGNLAWSWGPLADAAFLPRVVRDRFVLARAQWRVERREAERLLAFDPKDRAMRLREWRAARDFPRWLVLLDADNELPIDLEDEGMVDTLLAQLRGRERSTLAELFPAPDRLCVRAPDGRRTHELIVPFVRVGASSASRGSAPPAAAAATPVAVDVRRTFPPGSEWLTLKLYGGTMVVDDLVRERIGPLALELVAEGRAERWFFVRYADPHGHLRVRFAGNRRRLEDEVWPRVEAAMAPWIADGRLWRVSLDTYEREVERYGGAEGIELCEQLFHHDSDAVVELLRDATLEGDPDRRWRLALLGSDRLLEELALPLEARRELLLSARNAFHREFRASDAVARQIGAKYRSESASIAALLAVDEAGEETWSEEKAVLRRRAQRSAGACEALRRASSEGRLAVSLAELAQSLMHMHCNRLLRAEARTHELVLYDFLHRHYKGALARARSDARQVAYLPGERI